MNNLVAQTHAILKAFQEVWSFDGRDLKRPSINQVLEDLISKHESQEQKRLHQEFFSYGPIEGLLDLDGLQEIVINGQNEIWFEQNGKLKRHDDQFLSNVTFKNFIARICEEAEIKVDLTHPFADGRWKSFRIHIGRAPLTAKEFQVNLRKISQAPWTFDRLQKMQWASQDQMNVLKRIISLKMNTIFIGPTGCGKTSVLGACLNFLNQNERVVIIEDTDELSPPNTISTKLLTRPQSGPELHEINLANLVKQSLRMRPDRLVMGEVRGEEAKDLLLALATGHSGSLGTLHASDARQALLRLEMLVQLGAPQWNTQTVRQLIQLSVDALVICGSKSGTRTLEGIYKIAALESFGFLLEPLV